MVISKSSAREISRAIVNFHKMSHFNALKEAFDDALITEYMKEVPESVRDFFSKFPHYCSTTYRISIQGNGWSYTDCSLSNNKVVPFNENNQVFYPNEEQGERLLKLYRLYTAENKNINELRSQIQTTLLELKSFKKIRENFPIAIPYLPSLEAQLIPIINLTDLVSKITNL